MSNSRCLPCCSKKIYSSSRLCTVLLVYFLVPLSDSSSLEQSTTGYTSSISTCTSNSIFPISISIARMVLTPLLLLISTLVSPSYEYQSKNNKNENNDVYNDNQNSHHPQIQLSGGKPATLNDFIEEKSRPNKRPENLTCHVCHSETHPECFNISALALSVDYGGGGDMNNVNWVQDSSSRGGGGGNYYTDGFIGYPHTCESENAVCMVRKFAFTLSNGTGITSAMKTFAIKRNCSSKSKCENGCVVMGERTRIYVCSQCCSTPLCNTGNGASTTKIKPFQSNWIQVINNLSFIALAIVIS